MLLQVYLLVISAQTGPSLSIFTKILHNIKIKTINKFFILNSKEDVLLIVRTPNYKLDRGRKLNYSTLLFLDLVAPPVF